MPLKLLPFRGALERQARVFSRPGARPPGIDEETLGSLPIFAEIARNGGLCVQSQEGLRSRSSLRATDRDLWDKCGGSLAKYTREGGLRERGRVIEKAFLQIFAGRNAADRIVRDFNMRTDKVAFAVSAPYDDGPRMPVTWIEFDTGGLVSLTTLTTTVPDEGLWSLAVGAGYDLDPSSETLVTFLDPVPGRKGRGRGGLWGDILRIMQG